MIYPVYPSGILVVDNVQYRYDWHSQYKDVVNFAVYRCYGHFIKFFEIKIKPGWPQQLGSQIREAMGKIKDNS